MGGELLVRRTTPEDAERLRSFRCSTGAWYETEAERFIQGPLAELVAQGFGAWVVEKDGQMAAVGAHDGRPHPDKSGSIITWVMVLATRVDASAPTVRDPVSISRLVQAMIVDVDRSGRSPYWFALVAAENESMRRFCEQAGFTAGPVPSDERYLFYTAKFAPLASAPSAPA